jgi:hypothetical protein
MINLRIVYWSAIFCAHARCYYLTFGSFSLFDLSNKRFSKKSIFTCCSVLTDFCHYLHLPLNLFLFEFFWSEELLKKVATVANVLMDVLLELKLNQKWIYYLAYTNVANENCVKFCMKEVFKCRERRMMWWDEGWIKAQAWGCPCHSNKYPRSTSVKAWGCPRHPLLHQQNIRSSFKTLYFYCFICYMSFLERLYFCFQFYFVFFAVINGWIPAYFFWRRHTPFSLPRIL